jgi:cellulose synthase/poly-beta-1,6-N-acetylglucosamine synthase-like glycosyltransferase
MMEVFILISLALGLCLLFGILLHGYRHVMDSQAVRPAKPFDIGYIIPKNFKIDLIVPVTGNSPELKDNLHSLLNQDFPDYRTFLVTRDHLDPAVPIIKSLLDGHPNAIHITAGHAVKSGQKNHNLLAGIKASGESNGVLVFCDSSHHAPPTLLSDLIWPILQKDEIMTTGFHRIVPEDFRVATIGMMVSVMAIHLLQGNRAFTQPWGGATAIRRSVFVNYRIVRLWSKTVVDDFTMGPYLRRHGIRCKPVSTACLTTPLAGQKLGGWVDWLTRQLLYMKYYTRWEWLGASFAAYLLVAPILFSITAMTGFFFGLTSLSIVASCAVYFAVLTATAVFVRQKFLKKSPFFRWLFTFYCAHFVACWCYVRTWFLNTISWRGISYKMTRDGRVTEVIFDKGNHTFTK